MAGISDKAIKTNYAENKYRCNGGNELQNKEFSDGTGLEAYDANFRMYDPQIGRFFEIDPLADISENSSPYSFVFNNPIKYNDPSGLDTNWKTLPTATVTYKEQLPRSNVNTPLADLSGYAPNPAGHALFISMIDHTIKTPPTWWDDFSNSLSNDGHILEGKNLIDIPVYLDYTGGIAPSGSWSRFDPEEFLRLYKVIKNLQWTSRGVAQAAKLLLWGAKDVTVKDQEEAEELFLGLYQADPKGYTNTTGMTTRDMKDEFMFPNGKAGTYHWDLNDTQHGGVSHLQIHDHDGNIVRIFFGK
jgi:RHS repeat-associated protein